MFQGQMGISFVPGDDFILRNNGRALAITEFGERLGYAENHS
jgi:hypothetical protein